MSAIETSSPSWQMRLKEIGVLQLLCSMRKLMRLSRIRDRALTGMFTRPIRRLPDQVVRGRADGGDASDGCSPTLFSSAICTTSGMGNNRAAKY